jgi:hypothetical protein
MYGKSERQSTEIKNGCSEKTQCVTDLIEYKISR